MDLRSIINNEGGDTSRQDKAQPATPAQTGPSPGLYREYSQHSQPAPPSRQASQDYGAQAQRFTSPTAYQGSFQGRPPPPPPLQPPSTDLRSPATSSHYSGQSPFRHTPSSSTSGGAFPFPQNAAPPQSPGQAHQYPPPPRHRESYSQSEVPPQSQHINYPRASPVPLTPPIGSSNASYPFPPHQRPQSSHSSPTPTSAQNQQNLYTQHLQESPVANTTFPPTPFPQDQAQRSQPGTPFRQPMTVQRQSTGSYPFPSSPYQQRAPSLGVHQDSTKVEHISPSPSISAAPTTPGPHNQSTASAPESKRNSESEREHSMSVSPKTTVFGQPKSEATIQTRQRTPAADLAPTPAKRKIDDRRSSDARAPSSAPNGDQPMSNNSQSPREPRKRRRYNEPPIWAQSWMLYKKNKQLPASSAQVNGRLAAFAVPEPSLPHTPKQEADVSPATTKYDDILGPWEPSISDTTPVNDLTKAIADFLYLEVVNRNDWGELESRGVAVEIEAKLGQLIDKETNQRYYLPVLSECVLAPSNRISFRSSMTEEQHKRMNEFLNGLVTQTHPSNVNRPKPRVPIQYAHRRERDSFYEMPKAIVQTLPPTIQHLLKQGSHHPPKVRITHDQKTGAPLAQIIKTRVRDLDIYIPNSPLDCRISVNLEMRYDGDSEALARGGGTDKKNQPDRNKDRLSYTQSHYQIDLTQVTSASGEKEHELEIEIETKTLVEQGQRLQASQPHRYDALVEGLINNIHVLTKELSLPLN